MLLSISKVSTAEFFGLENVELNTVLTEGYQVWVWGTIPSGVGSNLIDVSIDGGAPTSVTRTSNGSAVYNEPYFSSDLLRNGYHQIVVTGRGSADSGNSEFLLDRFEFQTDDETPSFTSSSSSSSTSASTTAGTSSTASATNSTSSGTTGIASSGDKKTSAGPIVGAVIGALALIALLLGYLLWRRRKRSGDQTSGLDREGDPTRRNGASFLPNSNTELRFSQTILAILLPPILFHLRENLPVVPLLTLLYRLLLAPVK